MLSSIVHIVALLESVPVDVDGTDTFNGTPDVALFTAIATLGAPSTDFCDEMEASAAQIHVSTEPLFSVEEMEGVIANAITIENMQGVDDQ